MTLSQARQMVLGIRPPANNAASLATMARSRFDRGNSQPQSVPDDPNAPDTSSDPFGDQPSGSPYGNYNPATDNPDTGGAVPSVAGNASDVIEFTAANGVRWRYLPPGSDPNDYSLNGTLLNLNTGTSHAATSAESNYAKQQAAQPNNGVGTSKVSRIPLSDYQAGQLANSKATQDRQARVDAQTQANNQATQAQGRRGQDWQIVQAAQQGRISVAEAMSRLAGLRHQEQSDPFKFGEYLQHLAALPAGSGNPVQSLIGSGVKIAPDTSGYDSIQGILQKVLDEYNKIPSFGAAEQARGALENPATSKDAQTFLRQTPENLQKMFGGAQPSQGAYGFDSGQQAMDFADQIKGATPEQLAALTQMAQGHASGGAVKLTQGPAVVVDASTGRELATLNENDTPGTGGRNEETLRATAQGIHVQPGQDRSLSDGRQQAILRQARESMARNGVKGFAEGGDLASALRALAEKGLDSPEKVQSYQDDQRQSDIQRLAATPGAAESYARYDAARANDQQPAQAAPPAPQGRDIVSAIQNYGQTPLAQHAMALASHGLEGTVGGPAGDSGQAIGPYQIRTDVHPISGDDAADPWKSTEFMSNDYNLAAERVMRENPGLFERDPAQAAALVAYYAEKPANMYDERRYRDVYSRIPKFADGGTVTVGGLGDMPYMGDGSPFLNPAPRGNPAPGSALPAWGITPDVPPDTVRGVAGNPPVGGTPVGPGFRVPQPGEPGYVVPLGNPMPIDKPLMGGQTGPGNTDASLPQGVTPPSTTLTPSKDGEAGQPADQITAIKPTQLSAMAATAPPPAINSTPNTGGIAQMAQSANTVPGTQLTANAGGTAQVAGTVPATDPSIGWSNPLPKNTWAPPPNAISQKWTLSQYVWMVTADPNFMPGSTTQQKIDAATGNWNADKYMVAGAQKDAATKYTADLAAWQGRENQHQRDLQTWADQQRGGSGGGDGSGGDGTIQPADAQAIALGKALRPLGFATPEMLSYLDRGQAPPPGTVTDAFMAKLPPSLRLLLQGVIKAFGNNVDDYEASRKQFTVPGARLSVMSR